jgi:hypothetical protein
MKINKDFYQRSKHAMLNKNQEKKNHACHLKNTQTMYARENYTHIHQKKLLHTYSCIYHSFFVNGILSYTITTFFC